ncbi:AprI/Inh family metalloprotease inhibitor [Methylobacterium dankookense]|uniref:Alkaline proteinase inhibitor/ Outer membrane lipoprotein Omp19 domain-containing protein n=1 Tax=Methylobacterium dankookense TaxID=560405 RepID=A0A564FVH6_9HYPH|nr:AprI/Inh family metalloprotease inhibitor [Methylobacterium dankookense]GJD58742.1 hypothetical protein IFDJLNFL_4665 [Methylobacterium dankookense]VUF11864.1 hypothetical protein MTDSW087_01549 [Methylobacterium dankookense]
MRRILLAASTTALISGFPAAAQEAIPSRPPEMPPTLPGAMPGAMPGTLPGTLPEPAAPGAAPEAPIPAAGRLPDRFTGVPGTWDLSRDGTNFRCVMTLALDSGQAGRRLAFPAGCRRALPVTTGMAGWLWTEAGLRLVDRNLRPLLIFARRPDGGSLVARAESGEVYSFVPLDIAAMRPSEPGAGALPDPAPAADPAAPHAAQPVAASPAGSNPEAGLYALDRYRDRDTCRLDLAVPSSVHILPGCRDGGIQVFDPVSWNFAAGRLTLKARRGHTVGLVPTGDGAWRRDPETGTTFVLRKVEP